MSKRAAGVVFIFVAAFLYAVRILAAAIYGSNMVSWSAENFMALLQYVGNGPIILAVIALVVGVSYLIWAEVDAARRPGA